MNRRGGFTLIELLAASALAAALMLVLFQVLGTLGRARTALAHQADATWESDALDLVRRDLANATAMQIERNRLTLTGHGSIDRRTLAAGQEAVTVVYEIDRSRLLRRQLPRGGLTNEPAWCEVVCVGVSHLYVEPQHGARQIGLPPRDALSTPVRIRLEGPDGPVVDEVIVVR
jgi:prepilin-type N-terminal cleavage/methylation domain-containing protein